jgi:hypothetical protein
MAYGRIKGRFCEIRVGLVDANMGGEKAPVKSTTVESASARAGSLSEKL